MNKTVQSAPGAGGSGTPGGSDTQVQFNDGGAFNGEAAFNYDKTNDQLTVPGLTITQDQFYSGVITPSQITADQNNYNPTGLATAAVLRLSSDASRNITGIEGGESGRVLYVMNVGAFNIVLINQSLSSTNVNRLDLFADTIIAKDCGVLLFYDGTDSRWRLCALTGASTIAGTDTQVQYNDGGVFGAESTFTYNKTSNTLTVTNAVVDDLTANSDSVLGSGSASVIRLTSGHLLLDTLNSPAQITSNQNDYTPAVEAIIYRLSSDASRDITGWAEPSSSNRLHILHNVGSFNIVLKDSSASSAVNNRFALNADVTILPDQSVIIVYDETSFKWRCIYPGSGGATTNALLDGSNHTDTLAGTVADGDTIIGNVTPKWSRLAISVPAANVRNVFGVDNGETRPSWKAMLDGTNPAAIGTAAPGTSLIAAHRDHVHAADHANLSNVTANQHHNQAHALDGADHTLSGATDGHVLKATGATTFAFEEDNATITFIIDGGGSAITTGIKGDLEIPFGCVIQRATALADQSGSIVVDIWKDTYANYPPTDADSITASAPVTISTATKSQDSTLTGWTTTITAGDTLRFNVDSITTCTRVTISLKVRKT